MIQLLQVDGHFQKLPPRERIEQEAGFRRIPNALLHFQGFANDVEPGDARAARRWFDQCREHFQKRRLAGAVGADQPNHLPAGHGQVDTGQRRSRPVLLPQSAGFDHRFRQVGGSRRAWRSANVRGVYSMPSYTYSSIACPSIA